MNGEIEQYDEGGADIERILDARDVAGSTAAYHGTKYAASRPGSAARRVSRAAWVESSAQQSALTVMAIALTLRRRQR